MAAYALVCPEPIQPDNSCAVGFEPVELYGYVGAEPIFDETTVATVFTAAAVAMATAFAFSFIVRFILNR